MKIKIISLAFLLANILTVPAYSKLTDESVVRLQLSWKHQFQFAGYYAAIEKGFYKEAGLAVVLLEGKAGDYCDEKMLQQVEFCNASGSVVKQFVEGQGLVALASIIQYSPSVLITKKSAGLVTPKDLIGKRVELLNVGVPIPEIQAMFEKEGVSLSQLKLRENTVNVSALVEDNVDAIYGFSTNEPYLLRELGIDYNVISPKQFGIDFYNDILLTSKQELESNPYRVKAFLDASLRGWHYAMSHQEEIADLIVQKYAPHLSRAKLLTEAKALEKLMLPNLIEIGHSNPHRWQHTADILASLNLIDPDYSLDGFIYDPNRETSYLSIIKLLLAVSLFLTAIMSVLWLFNSRLNREITERIEIHERLRIAKESADKIAYTDDLSGLGSRRSFYERGKDAIKLADVNYSPLSVILLDIDHFKKVNDNYGHLTGDHAICEVARVILKVVRSRDIQGRIGGEEFAILLPDTDSKGAAELAERVRQSIADIKLESDGQQLSITASFGVASYGDSNKDIKSLMQSCDKALYKAKNQGRNQVVSG